jgi:hypothetical protein
MNFVQKFVGIRRSRELVPLFPVIMQDVQGRSRVPIFHELCSEVCRNQEVQGTGSIGFSNNAGCSSASPGPNVP